MIWVLYKIERHCNINIMQHNEITNILSILCIQVTKGEEATQSQYKLQL